MDPLDRVGSCLFLGADGTTRLMVDKYLFLLVRLIYNFVKDVISVVVIDYIMKSKLAMLLHIPK